MIDWSRTPRVQQTAAALRFGGVIAYPTEAVWGLGCDPHNPEAVDYLLSLKQQPVAKGLILVAADMAQVQDYLQDLTPAQCATVSASWPGPNTWLIPDPQGRVPAWVRGRFDSVAIRVSAHPMVAALCRAFGGPLISTSANPQGKTPARQGWQVKRYFGDQLDAIAPGQIGAAARPSQIRDLLTGAVVRPG
jgi:L-threonylcarbamoyladenylate synthase